MKVYMNILIKKSELYVLKGSTTPPLPKKYNLSTLPKGRHPSSERNRVNSKDVDVAIYDEDDVDGGDDHNDDLVTRSKTQTHRRGSRGSRRESNESLGVQDPLEESIAQSN